MADVKISQLPAATTPVDGTEVLPIVQSATTKQVSIANLTAGRAMSASSLTLTNPLAVTSGGTGLATTAAGTLLSSTALNTISATATPTLGVAGTTAGSLSLSGSTSGVVTINTAATAGTWSMTLPTSGGTNGYILTTNGSGVTSWTNPTALGVDLDVGSTAITGGTDKYILYNNNGTLGNYAVTGTGTTAVMSTSPALSGNVTLDSATFSPSSPGTNGNMAMTGTLAMGSSFLRNRIINGGLQFWQRGTSGFTTGGNYCADRFFVNGTLTAVAQSTDVPTGYKYSLSISGSNYPVVYQRVEALNTSDLSGATITISFWLKQSTGAGTGAFAVGLFYPNSADNWGASTQIGSYQSINTTSSWAQYSVTFTGLPSGATNGLAVSIGSSSASSSVTLITGVQLEVGSVATPFERRQYGQELALCQRYFNLTPIVGSGIAYSSTAWDCTIAYPVQMRAATDTITAKNAITITNVTTADYAQSSANIAQVVSGGLSSAHLRLGNFSGLSANSIYLARNNDMFVNVSAEL